MNDQAMRVIGVPEKFLHADLTTCTDLTRTLVDRLVQWAADPSGFCVLTGGVGTGKTYAAIATMRRVCSACPRSPDQVYPDARFITEGRYLKGVRSGFNGGHFCLRHGNYAGQPWLMVIDDLGRSCTSEWAKQEIIELIDTRYSNNLPTIVTTNHTLQALGSVVDGRVVDRLVESNAVLDFGSKSLRVPERGK